MWRNNIKHQDMKLYLNDQIDNFDWQTGLEALSEQRRQLALRFRYDLGRRTCVAAYLLLCKALREVYGIKEKPVFEYGEHGKPVIVGHPEVHFNLSHCREAVACAVSDRPVGVDIESVRNFSESLLNYTMNHEEADHIRHAERPDIEFIRLWTMKEAVLKRTGEGLHSDLGNVLVPMPEGLVTVVSADLRYVYSICG